MKSASFYAAYIVKKLWTLAAVLLVFVAVSISVLRFSLPYMDKHKHRVESWINNQYGVQLAIGELNADWTKNGPSLVLKDIYLKQDEQSPIGLEISETQIEFDFWGSIRARQVQSQRFELSGMALSVNLARIQTAESEFPIVEALESLFLEQLHRFSLRNSVVDVVTRYDQQLIQIQQLSWVNKEERHQGTGQLRVVELANNSATFTLDLYGGKDNLSGTFYAKGEELDLSPWLNQLVRTQNQLTQSRGNFTFWAGIEQNQVRNVQIQLQKSEFAWSTPDTQVEAAIIGGTIYAVPDDFGWGIAVEDLTLESKQQSLITNWQGHIGRDGITRINNVNPINMQAILPILPLAFDKQTIDFINRLEPQARLNNLALSIGSEFLASVDFSQVAWNQVDILPGLSDLTGRFVMHDDIGRLTVEGVAGEIGVNNLLDENLLYDRLSIDGFFKWHERGVRIDVSTFNLNSQSLNINNQFSFDTQDSQLSLYSSIEQMPITQLKTLFPNDFLDAETKQYLSSALQSGQMSSAQVLWQGELDQYPFEQNQGVFLANVSLRDSKLKFDENWPEIEQLDIDLLFENKGLKMVAHTGRLQNVQLSELTAQIPSLDNSAILSIEAHTTASSDDVRELIQNSQLANTLGEALSKGINLGGELDTKLALTIPLNKIKDVVAEGDITLDGNHFTLPSLAVTFEDVHGVVKFRNDDVSVEQMKGTLLGQPVDITYNSNSGPAGAYLVNAQLQGDWQIAPLLEAYHPSMKKYLSGHASWQAETKLTLNGEAYAYSFELGSQLTEIGSALPAPFAKPQEAALPLLITGSGQNQASNFKLSLGDQITFEGVLPHDTMEFSRAHLAVGEEESVSMGLGFSISANLDYLDFDAWYEALSTVLADNPQSENPILSEPQRVYVNTQSMLIAGQKIENLELVAKHSTDDWLLEFNAEQIRAKVMFYDDWLNRGIDIKADFIELAQWQGEANEEYQPPDLNTLPPVNFECKSCKLFGKNLGRVDFSLSRAPKGMQIDSLRLNNDHGELSASGDWLFTDTGSKTLLNGELSSGDFGALVKGLGFDSGIKDSKGNFNFSVSWDDAPHKFSLASLNGNVDWRLTDGYLSEVSDKGARLFSILSLQSLVRKLSLDFRDVFAQGFFYDKMDGSFQLVDGKADTRDTIIDGAAGEMEIIGYADLANSEMDYLIEFTPNVTSSLPLLVYWMVNPATAIAALAIDQVLTEAKVISNVRYSVTGPLDAPVFTELGRKSKEIALPARNKPAVPKNEDSVPVELPDERVDIEVSDSRGDSD